jgi:glycosyltransferase involved in cell wall biosynthesis
MISVIMSNFNGEKHIEDSIRSVLNQNFNEYEFIIVDDGSTDKSIEIISNFHKQHKDKIFPIYKSINEGQSEGFNIGFKASKGEIICFIDSDDIWFSDKLRNVSDFFTHHGGFSLHQHNLFNIEDSKLTDNRFRDDLFHGDYFDYIKKNGNSFLLPQFIPTSGLSFPRHILERVFPIPKEFRTCADGYLTRTCFCYGDVASSDECWGAYRIHSSNNVYGNSQFNNNLYISQLLIPKLNEFYSQNNIDLRFSLPKKPYIIGFLLLSFIRPVVRYIFLRLFPKMPGEKIAKESLEILQTWRKKLL